MPPWGLYVHVPFCGAICPYCDFNVHLRRELPWEAFTEALLAELDFAADHEFAGAPALHSIYFGGGTPSLAPPALFDAVIARAKARFGLSPGAEISLEAMPKTLSPQTLAGYAAAGVNRLSLGWQSTHDHLLRTLGRQHRAADSAIALQQVRDAGFVNVSLDLIFAVPGQSAADSAADVAALIAAAPQ
ncbi:MAG: radical SAM protein, partial [Deltaproteobacteria bacterium]